MSDTADAGTEATPEPTPEAGKEEQVTTPPSTEEPQERKSILSEQEVETEPKEGEEAKPEEKKEEEEAKPEVPEKYDIKAKEGEQLDAVLTEVVSEFAKEQGFSNEQAQKLYDTFQQDRAEHLAAIKEAQEEANNKQWDEWQEALKSQVDYKEKMVLAKRAVNTMPEEVQKVLDGPWGDWPPLVNWLADVARKTGEHQVHVGGQGNPQKKPWDIMYPDMSKN